MARERYPRTDVIRALCAARRWGIDELADAAGLERRAVDNIWTGASYSLRPTVKAVADALEVNIGALLPPDDPESDEYGLVKDNPPPPQNSETLDGEKIASLLIEAGYGLIDAAGERQRLREAVPDPNEYWHPDNP